MDRQLVTPPKWVTSPTCTWAPLPLCKQTLSVETHFYMALTTKPIKA